MKTRLLFACISIMLTTIAPSYAQTLVNNMSSTNGDVYTVYKSGGSYYLGGTFNYVGLYTGYAGFTTTSNDYPNMTFPQFNGAVYTIIPDGSGGWYAGGNFTLVGGIAKSYLAHITSGNVVDAAFNANCNSTVRALARVGGRLYIGGNFTTVNGTSRLYAAAVNANTGGLQLTWNPAPNTQVNTIAPVFGADTTIWLGGNFTTINAGNISRPYLAKVNSTNGDLINGGLSADYIVNKIISRGDSVFVAGDFSRLGLKTDYLASITEGAGSPDQTMPNTNGSIRCIIPDGSGGWYVGGSFTVIGGISKNYIARVLSNKTVDATFTASCNSWVFSMVKDGGRLYLGGYFTTVNSTPRNYVAAVNANTGAVIPAWDAVANSYVYTLALKDTVVAAGGLFTTVKGKNAYRFAVLSKTDGTPIGGFPGYNSQLNKISVRGDSILTAGNYTLSAYYSPYSAKITTASVTTDPNFPATNGIIYDAISDGSGNYYVAGSFTVIGGVNQAYVAKLNSSFQVITGWAPVVNNQVRSLVLSGTTLYIGGLFSTTNSVSRLYVSALNTGNPGANKVWNSTLNSYAYSLVSDGTSIYAGGIFTQVNGVTTRDRLAKFDLNGNLDATWNPDATGGGSSVEKLAVSGTNILAAGSFTTIGGVSRNYLAKLNNTTGAAVNWATANSYVYSMYVDGTTCYVGGYFTSLTSPVPSTVLRNYLGGITISNGAITNFNPNPNSYVYAISKSGTNLYYGGQFTLVNGVDRKYLAASNVSTSALQTWNPSANYIVNSVNIDASNNVIIGGSFSGFQETSRTYASSISYTAKALQSWTPVIDNVVYDITYNDTKIFIGGVFHTVNGGAKNGLAAFKLNGVVQATNLNLTKGGTSNVSVLSLFATATNIYAGGDFDKAGAILRNDFVEADISAGAGTILATNAFADDIVYAIDVQGTAIVYGGNFRLSSFSNRNYLCIVRNASGNVAPWTPLPDSYVFDVALNYNKIFIAGQFDNVGGAPHPGAAAFNLNNGTLLTWNPLLTRAGQGYYADGYSVLADSNNVYIGGYFDQAGAVTRNNAVAVAATNAALLTWNPGPSYLVRTMALNSNNLFFGGDFTFCKGASRSYIAKIDSVTGLVNTTWNPGSNGYIYALAGNGTNIYAGGSYTQLGGVTRTSLGSVNANTGVTSNFDPVVQQSGGQGTVYTLAFDASNILYAGGVFNTAKGSTRNNAAAFATTGTGVLQSWDPNANLGVYALAVNGTTIYAGGNFTTLNGATVRNHLASVNNTTGTLLPFNPNINANVNALSLSGTTLYVGGSFTLVNGATSRSYLASYNTTNGNLNVWNPVANNLILGLASSTDTVYPGGYYTTLNATTRNYLAAVRGNPGTTLLPFNPSANYIVRSNFIADHTLLTGGAFSTISGTARTGFAVYALPALLATDKSADDMVALNKPMQRQFVLYPNPSSKGLVTLQLNNAISGKFSVAITSMDGKRVFLRSLESYEKTNTIPLNVAALPAGTYVVNVNGKEVSWSNNLVIER